ncbi:hypothetical protein P8452_09894 [Trifolium repens]|nr:hypothetical protein P8452_09894 [Trifolium repens]
MAGGVRSSLLHTTTFPTSLSGDLSPLASLIVEFFGLSRYVLLRIWKLLLRIWTLLVRICWCCSLVCLAALGFSAGVVVQRGSRSFCAILVFGGEFRWTDMVARGLCVVVVLAGSLGVAVLFFALRRNNVMVVPARPSCCAASVSASSLSCLQRWLLFRFSGG